MSQDNYDESAVKRIIVSGLQNKADPDTIKLEMFKSGVPFNKINPLYRATAIEAGLMADPKVVRKELAENIDEDSLAELNTWDDVIAAATTLAEQVEGATRAMAIGALRTAAGDAEIEFPKKPKTAGARGFAGSVIKSLIVDTLNARPDIDSYELFDLIIDKVTGDYRVRNSLEYFNMYAPVVLAGKYGVSLDKVQLGTLDKELLEKKYGGTTSYTKPKKEASDSDEEKPEVTSQAPQSGMQTDLPADVDFG